MYLVSLIIFYKFVLLSNIVITQTEKNEKLEYQKDMI